MEAVNKAESKPVSQTYSETAVGFYDPELFMCMLRLRFKPDRNATTGFVPIPHLAVSLDLTYLRTGGELTTLSQSGVSNRTLDNGRKVFFPWVAVTSYRCHSPGVATGRPQVLFRASVLDEEPLATRYLALVGLSALHAAKLKPQNGRNESLGDLSGSALLPGHSR